MCKHRSVGKYQHQVAQAGNERMHIENERMAWLAALENHQKESVRIRNNTYERIKPFLKVPWGKAGRK